MLLLILNPDGGAGGAIDMSELYVYICTKQTSDPYIPPQTQSLPILARDVSDGFYAIAGGHYRVGQIAIFPVQKAIPNHLLCDGHEEPKGRFPELYDYLGDSQGTPSDPDNFVLPNFVGAPIATAATADTETVVGGTVTSEVATPGTGGSGGSVNRPVDSGGRIRPNEAIP